MHLEELTARFGVDQALAACLQGCLLGETYAMREGSSKCIHHDYDTLIMMMVMMMVMMMMMMMMMIYTHHL